jgi:predicted RNA-binding protein YlqC (UPF0109 family)
MKELIDFIARALVDHPDEIEVRESNGGRSLQLLVAPDDLGKVIGRKGRTANSMRSLLQAAAGRRVELEISERAESGSE